MQKAVFVLTLMWALILFGQTEDVVTPKMAEAQKHLCANDSKTQTEGENCETCPKGNCPTTKLRSHVQSIREQTEAQARDIAFFEWAQKHSQDLASDLWMYMPGGAFLQGAANAKSEMTYRGRDLEEANGKVQSHQKILATLGKLKDGESIPDDVKSMLTQQWTDRETDLKGNLHGGERLLKGYDETAAASPGTPEGENARKQAEDLRKELEPKKVLFAKMDRLLGALESGTAKGGTSDLAEVQSQVADELKTRQGLSDGFITQIKAQQGIAKDQQAKFAVAQQEELRTSRKLPASERLKLYESRFKTLIDHEEKNPGFQTCGLTPAERFAIYLYSKGAYRVVNPALWGTDKKLRQEVRPYTDVFSSAMRKLGNYQGEVLRGVSGFPESVLAQHQVGKVVTYGAYTSTAVDKPFAGKIQFVIQSKTGHYISPFSQFWSEGEVLFDAGTKFEITRREDRAGEIKIWMKEVSSGTKSKH